MFLAYTALHNILNMLMYILHTYLFKYKILSIHINKKGFGTITIYPNINIWLSNAIANSCLCRECYRSVFFIFFPPAPQI